MERESHDLNELNVPPFCQCLNSKLQLNEWEGLVERESHGLKLNVPPFWQLLNSKPQLNDREDGGKRKS